jgi:hypothetical protein
MGTAGGVLIVARGVVCKLLSFTTSACPGKELIWVVKSGEARRGSQARSWKQGDVVDDGFYGNGKYVLGQ